MKPILDITAQLDAVFGGNDTALLQRGATMQSYLDCFKQAQNKLNSGQEAAMNTAQTSTPAAGMNQMIGAGGTFQKDMAACAAKFPIK
jgi:hypothetical protein